MFGSRAREWYFGEINLVLFINTFFYFVKFILRKTSNNQLFPSFFFFFLYLLLEHDVILKFFLYFLLFRLFLSSDLCFRVLRCPDNSTQMDTAAPLPIHSGLRTTGRSTSCSEIKKKKKEMLSCQKTLTAVSHCPISILISLMQNNVAIGCSRCS